ncbi:MAG: hypothetical protein J0L63_17215 [Anaerolineae bacterium]|nr:hypothetical protein [Anaerolineae bacterium]
MRVIKRAERNTYRQQILVCASLAHSRPADKKRRIARPFPPDSLSALPTTTTTNPLLGGNLSAFPPSRSAALLPLLLQNRRQGSQLGLSEHFLPDNLSLVTSWHSTAIATAANDASSANSPFVP